MAQRIRVGVPVSYDDNWIGGAYYVTNLVLSLGMLDDADRPEIVVLSREQDTFESIAAVTGYPHLRFRSLLEQFSFPERVGNSLSYRLTGKRLFDRRVGLEEIDLLFPSQLSKIGGRIPPSRHVVWIPDFQEHYYPEFFSDAEVSSRRSKNEQFAIEAPLIVLSSRSAERDLRQWYPQLRADTAILPVAVHHPEYESIGIDGLRAKYDLQGPYVLVSNQFWIHKNHDVVLRALHRLRTKGVPLLVVFTGKEFDYRAPSYTKDLISFVRRHDLERSTRFLGLIDRREQLRLMLEANAVVQPSLFEGWSTVIEDCKAMGQHVICSDLPVHREQVTRHAQFFNPRDDAALAGILEQVMKHPPGRIPCDYTPRRLEFGQGFVRIARRVVSDVPLAV